MADSALKALLDPEGQGRGVQILRRVDHPGGAVTSYYVTGGLLAPGHSRWIDVPTADTDGNKNTTLVTELKKHR